MKALPFRLAIGLILAGCSRPPQETAAQQTSRQPSANAQITEGRRSAITAAVTTVSPAVVTVQTTVIERTMPDVFSMMFGAQPGTRATPGLGSGFIVKSDGVIVTNAHVVAGASEMSVMMRDGTVYPAKLLGTDEMNDIAVIKIDAKDLPVVKLGDSSNLLIGEWAIAIGNPYGFVLGNSEPSVTAGVISGVGRNLIGPGEGAARYFDMIQTDASINPGNSGGPLVNADGQVIGVNSSIYSTSGGSIGLGFAIPINRVSRVVDDLVEHHKVRRPWIGVVLRRTSDNPRDVIAAGAVVEVVSPGSPAEKAGIQRGDAVVKVGTRPIRNVFDWEGSLLDLRVDESVKVTVKRGSREIPIDVKIADLPEVSAQKVQVLNALDLVTLTPAMRAERSIRSPAGAMIYKVPDQVSADIGVQAGDVIIQINNYTISTAEEAKQVLQSYRGRTGIRMVLERRGQMFVTQFVIQ